ncbi:DUF2478 domain-containing protein [Kaistia dalseonensis]|uniref:DUF2478 domain-containing protein n=1 Tax=Kaistia dalseonensis TaxID=410840 RepID=A0ABU0HAG7_9HYPH|nr:DUF2478 domain-containing protein [Kaistia dalseonensis]MCX5496250.1 DUF2478 domain-containing protein [Kaistia dalseonensis]MDQ0438868.1 hypothetical protein [Kaistia dalseonensis]
MSREDAAPDRPPITAIVYEDGRVFEGLLRDATDAMIVAGLSLAGLLQQSNLRLGRQKCDMVLHDLATGVLHPISEDRGPGAQGCSLDRDSFVRACMAAGAGLTERTSCLVLCKFGKMEVEGGGVRMLIEAALERGVPVWIGVSQGNLVPFRAFAGALAREISIADMASTVRLLLSERSAVEASH